MRHRLLHDLGLIGLIALAASLGSPWSATAAADAAQVTVVTPGGGSQNLALEALAGSEDVVERVYALRSSSGESSVTLTGFSLASILTAANVDTFGFSYLEAQRPGGGSVLLSRDQVLDEDAFADGPPLVYATATGTAFLRPAADASDLNASDSFEAPQGVSLVMRKGSPLRVSASASTRRTETGRPVRFEAVVERSGSGERLSYSWYFDDGQRAAGARATHVFRKRGSYDVVVGVTTAGDEVGTSAVVTIQVGEPLAGPDRKGGGRNRAAGAPDHGAAEGLAAGGGTGGSTGSGGNSATSGGVDAAANGASAGRSAKAGEQAEPEQEAAQRPVEQRVAGQLLEAPAAEPRERSSQAAARTGQPDSGEGGGVPEAALGVLATLGLLGLGALGEARGLRGLRSAVAACRPLGDKQQPHRGGEA